MSGQDFQHTYRPILVGGAIVLVLVFARWMTISYTPQRINDIACRAAEQIVQREEQSGQPLSPTALNLKKMLSSPRVAYRGLPFELKSHREHGFDTTDGGPPVIPYFKEEMVILNGEEVKLGSPLKEAISAALKLAPERSAPSRFMRIGKEEQLSQLSQEIQEKIRLAQEELIASGAKPYTEESRIEGLLAALRRAKEKNIAIVIHSPRRKYLLDLLKKINNRSKGESFAGVVLIAVTDHVSQLELENATRELQVSAHPISYKMGWRDFTVW